MEFWIKDMETDGEIRGKAFVHWKAWQEAYTGLVSQRYLDEHTLENSLDRAFRAADRCLVAGNGAGVIGFTSFGPARGEGPDTGEIYALYVLSEYYGAGVGAALLDSAMERLGEYPRICLWALKTNARALRFYEKHGFRPDGAEQRLEPLEADVIRLVLDRGAPTNKNNEEDAG